MEQNKWSEEEITRQLKGLPAIKDRQSKQALFQKIQADDKCRPHQRKGLPVWGIPALATACVLVLMVFFVPDLMRNSSMDKSMGNEGGAAESDVSIMSKPVGNTSLEEVEQAMVYHEPLLQEDIESAGQDWVTVAYLDEQAQIVIPISFLTNKGNYIDKVNEQIGVFDESRAGLAENPLQRAKISEEEETVIIDWPPKSIFSAEEVLLKTLIALTFSNEGQKHKVEFRSNGKEGYAFPHLGHREVWDLGVPGAPHFRYDTSSRDAFIVSLYSTGTEAEELPQDLQGALDVMDDQQQRGLKPLIPEGLELEVKQTGDDSVEVIFPDSFQLDDNLDSRMMIDAILLTAKSYGYQKVKFNNTGADSIGPYHMEKPIEGVAGINFYNH
jgi:hypothetical protein